MWKEIKKEDVLGRDSMFRLLKSLKLRIDEDIFNTFFDNDMFKVGKFKDGKMTQFFLLREDEENFVLIFALSDGIETIEEIEDAIRNHAKVFKVFMEDSGKFIIVDDCVKRLNDVLSKDVFPDFEKRVTVIYAKEGILLFGENEKTIMRLI